MKPVRTSTLAMNIATSVFTAAILGSCINPISIWFPPDVEYVAENATTASWYVDNASGNDANPGTKGEPLRTIQVAVNRIRSEFRDEDINAYKVYVTGGIYTPGNGLVSEGEYGLYVGVEHFRLPPPQITLSFAWDPVFSIQSAGNPTVFDTQGLLAQPYYFHSTVDMQVTVVGTINTEQ